MTNVPESINDLGETMILGYFETIRSVFLTKIALILTLKTPERRDRMHALLLEAAGELNDALPDANYMKALRKLNEEVILNLQEDAISGVVSSSWVVFEQIIKDLSKANYATDPGDISADYHRSIFGFSKSEKEDLSFFYYLRNAMAHYNGAYFASKDLDHSYDGALYKSVGHHGEKMETTIPRAFRICADLERYAMKAWTAAKNPRSARS